LARGFAGQNPGVVLPAFCDIHWGRFGQRLVELQHALVDLIRELDPHGLRYSVDVLQKA
jgi:hypothetical protein